MHLVAGPLSALLAAAAAPPQTAPAAPQAAPRPDVVVRGERERPGRWQEAETAHAVLVGDGARAELVRLARDLETLHLLLDGLFGRDGAADDAVKLRVTLIGGTAEFAAMGLRNLRWQQGPFLPGFGTDRYYDPRQDGAELATTRVDQNWVIARGWSMQSLAGINVPGLAVGGDPATGAAAAAQGQSTALLGLADSAFAVPPSGEVSVPARADAGLFAAYAQHWLLTYYPAAYPRWYLDGFGQVISTLRTRDGGRMAEYGRAPDGADRVLGRVGGYPVTDILSGRYVADNGVAGARRGWTPVHAWLLTHYLFFDDVRRPQLRRYLSALAEGRSSSEAAAAFGEPAALVRDVRRYHGARKPFLEIGLPAGRVADPLVRRLSLGEEAFVKGRVELGSRVEPAVPGLSAREAERQARARDGWLAALRADAARRPDEGAAQRLLAEAECRAGTADACDAAAAAATAASPGDPAALAWAAAARLRRALELPAGPGREAALRVARAAVARANRADTDAVLPLLLYARSFEGAAPPPLALDALARALDGVPSSPATRLELADALAAAGRGAEARSVLLPVVAGPYDAPEKGPAERLMARLPARAP